MAVTVQTTVQTMSRLMGGYQSLVSTSNGDTDTFNDTALQGEANDWYAGWWLRGTSGANNGKEVRVKQFRQSGGILDTHTALSGSTETSDTAELHKYLPPSKLMLGLDQARLVGFPWLSQNYRNDDMHTPYLGSRITVPTQIKRVTSIEVEHPVPLQTDWNFLSNQDRESTDNLTASSVTLATYSAETGYTVVPKYGSAAVKVSVAATTAGTVTEAHTATVADLRGIRCTYAVWVYCRYSARVTVRLSDGTTNNDSAAHGGNGWELLSVQGIPDAGTTAITLTVRVSSGGAINFFLDDGWFYMGERDPIGFDSLTEQWRVINLDGDRYIQFTEPLAPNRQLRIFGEGLVPAAATYGTSQAMDGSIAHLYALQGCSEALKMFGNEVSALSRDEVHVMRTDFEQQVRSSLSTLGRRPKPMRLVM